MKNIPSYTQLNRSMHARFETSRVRRFAAILLTFALFLSPLPALATEDDLFSANEPLTAQSGVNMSTGDVTLGYVAQAGAWLNPLKCNERDLVSINHLVFESVVELNENLQPVPLLADSWTVQDKTWTFRLRSQVTFHSGEEMVAADIVASYEMFVQQTTEDNPYTARLSLIESMEATDAFTLTVKAKNSGMITLYAMTFPVMQRNTRTEALPRGTGPYWFIRYDQDNAVRLESNPFWWKQQPEIQSLVGVRFDDTAYALEALQRGIIDSFGTRLSSAAVNRKLSDLSYMDYSTTTYEMLVPNLTSSSNMSDLRVRQAVMYAIDRTTLVSNAYLDMGQQSEVPVMPGSWIYESQSAIYNYSPERALQLLMEAGWSNKTGETQLSRVNSGMIEDLEVTIITYNEASSSIRGNAVDQIAKDLNAVGFKTTVKVGSRENVSNAIKEGSYDLALVAVNLSEVPYLAPMFSDGGKLNFSGYSSDSMNNLLSATLTAATEDEFKKAFSDLQMQIANELPVMGLLFRTGTLLSTRQLAGLTGIRETNTMRGLEFVTED